MTEIAGQFAGGDAPEVLAIIDAARRAGALRALAGRQPGLRAGLNKAADYWSGVSASLADALCIDAGLVLIQLADEAAGMLGKAPAPIPGQEGQ